MIQRIYLDHNATTPIDQHVLKILISELSNNEGNPSSIHFHGKKTQLLLEKSRETVARYLNIKTQELIFTSGGTEGANLLLQGFFGESSEGHIITSNVEHSCVDQTVKRLEKRGCEVSFLPAGIWGAVTPEAVRRAIRPNTKLITLMAVNNETGVKTDIASIAAIAKEAHIPFIVDGVALLGKEAFSIPAGVSAMFFSGHKIHAPSGIGAVFCRQSLRLTPLFLGGSQEFNRRAGTENLSGIVAFAAAVDLLNSHQETYSAHMSRIRDRLEEGLKSQLKDIIINGEGPRVVNTSNISFLGVDGESLLIALDMEGLSVSHGSACASGALEPSRILLNMGIPLTQARSALRLSVSRFTTEKEIDRSIEIIVKAVKKR